MNSNTAAGEIIFVDHGINLQQTICEFIHQEFNGQLPDLTNLHILAPTPDLSYSLRNVLLSHLQQQQVPAYIGATISPLKKWVETNIPLTNSDQHLINNHSRLLLILDALKQYPAHFQHENLWQVSSALLQLFDELNQQHISLKDLEADEWAEKLQSLYGLENINQHLNTEARLIYTLWQAWQTQLAEDKLTDRISSYNLRLQSLNKEQVIDHYFIIAGIGRLSRHELLWLKQLATYCPVKLFIQANPDNLNALQHPDHLHHELCQFLAFEQRFLTRENPRQLFELAFQSNHSISQRAAELARESAADYQNISLFVASSEEQEATAVELQVRRWLLEGKRNIAIVTENRKLARRVRALLERAGVNLVDSVGWSLSTTSAATIIERWLECIEQDFSHQSLLDLIKSPFFHFSDTDAPVNKETLLQHVYRLEQDIIIHSNISGNIERYLENLHYQEHKLQHWESACYEFIRQLLNHIRDIARPFVQLHKNNVSCPASQYLNTLITSLDSLGITTHLRNDDAGEKILTEIAHMQLAIAQSDPVMDWYDFRTWLASALEDHHYSPEVAASHVRLLNLQQSNSGYYEALIIASANAAQLPGNITKTAFFNHNVRASLGLPDWKQHKQTQLYLFRRLLESADQLLLSYCAEKNEEWQEPSPWLQSVSDIYQHSFGMSLENSTLHQLINIPQTQVLLARDISLPEPSHQPMPELSAAELPSTFSASRHQRLINCPYLFFCNDILQLRPQDEVLSELQKAEYGSKVHRILEKFHLQTETHLATDILDPAGFHQLLTLLEQISIQIFKNDIEDNFLHRGWLKRWLDHSESYLNWQKKQQQNWTFKSAEQKYCSQFNNEINIEGRIDRIDTNNHGLALIDYKTGSKTPSQTDVENGEDVQLVSYAMLLENVLRAEYLKLDGSDGAVQSGAALEGEDLITAVAQSSQRLETILQQIKDRAALIANGDPDSCQHCKMSGLCRQPVWSKA